MRRDLSGAVSASYLDAFAGIRDRTVNRVTIDENRARVQAGRIIERIAVIHRREHRRHVEHTRTCLRPATERINDPGQAVPSRHDIDATGPGAANIVGKEDISRREKRERSTDRSGVFLIPLDPARVGSDRTRHAGLDRDVPARTGSAEIRRDDHIVAEIERIGESDIVDM